MTRNRNKLIAVVKGYHYSDFARNGHSNSNAIHINLNKAYYFKVNHRTKYRMNMAKGHTALVLTKYGYRTLIVNKVISLKGVGSKAIAYAHHLKPVVAFRKRTLHLNNPRVKN